MIWEMSSVQPIGVGAGEVLGVQNNFSRISPNLPENFSHTDHEDLFWEYLQKTKKRPHAILQTLGAVVDPTGQGSTHILGM